MIRKFRMIFKGVDILARAIKDVAKHIVENTF